MRYDSLPWVFTAFVDFAAACNDDLLAICSDRSNDFFEVNSLLLPSELQRKTKFRQER